MQAFKHVFTSPSSVDKEPKATRSGNARLHNMTHVTPASIAYVATQVLLLVFSFVHFANFTDRFASPLAPPLSSPAQTLSQIRSVFTIVCWRFWVTRRRRKKWTVSWTGGIGKFSVCMLLQFLTNTIQQQSLPKFCFSPASGIIKLGIQQDT